MKASKVVFPILLILMSLCFINTQLVRAAENSWASKAPMPVTLFPEVAVVNEKIYVITDYYNYEYDAAADTWTEKTPLPTRRDSFGIAVYQNKIYAIGGKRGENLGTNEVYDPVTDTWETKASMPTNRAHLDANVVNGKIYLIGGAQYSQMYPFMTEYDVNEVYDPVTDSWTTKAPLPTPTGDYVSAVVNSKIYIMAGGGGPSSRNQIYDAETNAWTSGAALPTAIRFAGAAATTGVVAPKRIYVIGGYSQSDGANGLNQVYDPEKDTWSLGAPMPTARYGLAVAVVNDVLYAIGGSTGENEQYTPFGFGTPTKPQPSEPFPTTLIVAVTAIMAVGAIALLLYFRRTKKQQEVR